MGQTLPKPHDLSRLVDARIGNPDASPTQIISEVNFLDGVWITHSNATIDSLDTFTALETNDGVKKNNIIKTGGKYLIHLVGNNAGTDFELRNYGGIPYDLTGSASGAFDLWIVFTSIDEGICLTVDNGSCTMSTIDLWEWSGEELVPDPDVGFVANLNASWVVEGNNTKEQDGDAVKCTYVDDDDGMLQYLRSTVNSCLFENLAVGGKYKLVVRAKVNTGSVDLQLYDGGAVQHIETITNTEYQVFSLDFIRDTNTPYIKPNFMSAGEIIWIEILSVMKVTGLVAAYNMIPSPEGVLVDISGEGNNGAIDGPISSKDGLVFDGEDDEILLTDVISFPNDFSICVRMDYYSTSDIFIGHNSNNDNWISLDTSDTRIIMRVDDNNYVLTWDSGIGVDGESFNLIVVRSGGLLSAYANGVKSDSVQAVGTVNLRVIGTGAVGYTYHKGLIENFEFFNYTFSAEQAAQYNNSFQKLEKRGNFSDHPVGSTI